MMTIMYKHELFDWFIWFILLIFIDLFIDMIISRMMDVNNDNVKNEYANKLKLFLYSIAFDI